MNNSLTKKILNKEYLIKILFLSAASISILATVAIFFFLFYKGLPGIFKIGLKEFIFTNVWHPDANDTLKGDVLGKYGILSMIIGSIYATIGALIIGGTLGLFTAIYLSQFCPKKLKWILTQIINLLAGIPSVIFGFFGIKLLLPILGNFSSNGSGSGLLAVSLILGIMITPTITVLSKDAIDSVNHSYYQSARALGASHKEAIFLAVVPAAKSGITASFILGIGRAIGETMAVIMVAGNNAKIPNGLFKSFRTMTANIVIEMGYAGELQLSALIGTGCVLFLLILVINHLFNLILKGKKYKNNKCKKEKNKRFNFNFIKNLKYKRFLLNFKMILCYTSSIFAILMLLTIVIFVLVNGLPNINKHLLLNDFSYGEKPTIMPSIVATLMLIVLTIVIAVPFGVMTAIYLTEYTKLGSKFAKLVKNTISLLAGIPSIVYGLFGLVLFCNIMNLGISILSGSLTVTIMIIPVLCRSTQEALLAVSNSFREGSYALGASKARTIFRVVLPSAMPGIISGIILSIGRVISESAPLMFTMGSSLKGLPKKGFSSSGTTLAVALYALSGEGLFIKEAYATACILMIMVIILNLSSTILGSRLQKKLLGSKK